MEPGPQPSGYICGILLSWRWYVSHGHRAQRQSMYIGVGIEADMDRITTIYLLLVCSFHSMSSSQAQYICHRRQNVLILSLCKLGQLFHRGALRGLGVPTTLDEIPRFIFHFRTLQSAWASSHCNEPHDLKLAIPVKGRSIKEYLGSHTKCPE